MSGGVEWVLCAHTYEGRVLCVCSGCCVHTQGTHIGGESVVCGGVEWVLCAHTRYTHRRRECSVWRCGVGVVCTHIGGKSVVCGVCSGPTHTYVCTQHSTPCVHITLYT